MTTLKAIVSKSEDKGPSTHGFVGDDGSLLIDTSPDRLEVELSPLNCSISEFMKWFVCINEYRRYGLITCDSGTLIDLAGTDLDLSIGSVIEISFEQYFEALLEVRIEAADRFIHQRFIQPCEQEGLFIKDDVVDMREFDLYGYDIPFD